jgi:tyramine---L-glutamate ligase
LRLFISEYFSSGAASRSTSASSLDREGLAMLAAIVEDASHLPGCQVVTTLDATSQRKLSAEVIPIRDPFHESVVFQKLLGEVDAVLIIAPETDGILARRCGQVASAGVPSWNCSRDAIELCGDKLKLAAHLELHGFPTISTRRLNLDDTPEPHTWPAVLKPIDGAGSSLTFLIQDEDQWIKAIGAIRANDGAGKCLIQPFTAGKPLSIGVNVSLDGRHVECLAIGEQRLTEDGSFRYLGGLIPAPLATSTSARIEKLVVEVCRSISGLAGYIGMDLILNRQGEPILVEINPRLTTAYVGYRQLYATRLPQRWLHPESVPITDFQKSEAVEFLCSEF